MVDVMNLSSYFTAVAPSSVADNTQTPTFTLDATSASFSYLDNEGDLHFCGPCENNFSDIDSFLVHKKCCSRSQAVKQIGSGLLEEVSAQTVVVNNVKKAEVSNSSMVIQEKPLVTPSKSLACTVIGCKYVAKFSKDMTRHLRVHTGERPYVCSVCLRAFSRSDKLLVHIRLHNKRKPYSCQFCSYVAADNSSLRKHIRIHSDEKPFECQVCPYRCRDPSQLVVHLRFHTSDAPFVCLHADCKAKFKTSSDLKRHERIHTGEKPHSCPHCAYTCSIRSNLKSHINSQHSSAAAAATVFQVGEKKPISCSNCDFNTTRKALLRKHKCLSSVKTPSFNNSARKIKGKRKKLMTAANHTCSLCGSTFVRQDSLGIHMKRKHGMKSGSTTNNEDRFLVVLKDTSNATVTEPAPELDILVESLNVDSPSNLITLPTAVSSTSLCFPSNADFLMNVPAQPI